MAWHWRKTDLVPNIPVVQRKAERKSGMILQARVGMASSAARRTSRRVFMCTECHKAFRTREELYMHAELCLLEAFEMEASQMLADMPALEEDSAAPQLSSADADGDAGEAGPASALALAKENTDAPPQLRLEKAASQGQDANPAGRTRAQAAAHSQGPTRTLETPAGLKLMVSVERAADAGLADEIDSLDPGDLDEDELTALADEDVSLPPHHRSPQRAGQGPKAPVSAAKPTGNVIAGALANGAEEDMYKPKMECPTCGLVLYRHNFSTHYRIHTGEMPFHCTYCEKRFRTTSALKVHVRAHTGEKPYVCPRCNYACITKRNLDRHIINNHVREGTRRGPRYRRSRYRLSDPHHEEYLISMGGGGEEGGGDQTGEEWEGGQGEELYGEPGPVGAPSQRLVLQHDAHEEVSVEIELNPHDLPAQDHNVVVVDADHPDQPPDIAAEGGADSAPVEDSSPRRSARARVPTSKAAN